MKWKRKCIPKYMKHFACKQFKKKCGPIDFPVGNNLTTEVDQGSVFEEEEETDSQLKQDGLPILEQCRKWKKACAKEQPGHFSCKQHQRNCQMKGENSNNSTAAAPKHSAEQNSAELNRSSTNVTSSEVDSEETPDLLDTRQ
ncbi:unnamed protein product [Nippostrongylus brasiliensis]|uniref:Protamine-2 n=1 Tax=Nippostrongylus brasiliensis TaxID=27835 RepID=A0A0N4YPI7_NIPBR|nr:unnamed protein product [Nippostrongylus brasiliensis]